MHASPTDTSLSFPQLRADLTGRVIGPDDADYDKARTVFLGGVDKRPAVIVRVANADDVAYVIALARRTGLELAVRSGGHSSAGQSVTEGGIVLDLADMKAIDIDVEGKSAWAETGLTALEYSQAVGKYGLATGFGDTGSVGLGGITTGGGIGYLVRKFGMTIDALLAADIVTADGDLLRVDADHHPDLFWAIRGGGGNFGVATRFQLRLSEVPSVVGGMLVVPATAETVAGFIAASEAAPEELTTIANVMPCPPMPFVPEDQHGQLVIFALMTYAGDADAGEAVLAPFRALATPLADMLHPMPYPEIYPPEGDDYHPLAISRTMFIDRVDGPTAETIMKHLEASDAAMRVAQIRVLGGAMARVPPEATAYAHRTPRILVNIATFYEGPDDQPARQAWVEGFMKDLNQGEDGAYVNFVGDEGPERVRAAYPGATWDRLRELKRRYDPSNVFRLNQNIPPAGDGA